MQKNLVCVASHTITFCKASGSWLHIPDGFWVMWEGPHYHSHSLGDGSEHRRENGLKSVCIAPRCTSVCVLNRGLDISYIEGGNPQEESGGIIGARY